MPAARPDDPPQLRRAATTLRIGRRQGVADVKVYDNGRGERLVATAVITLCYLSDDRAEPRVGRMPVGGIVG